MPLKPYGFTMIAATVLSACMASPPAQDVDPLTDQLSGKTGVHGSGTTITLQEDGRITGRTGQGEAINGVWEVRNGRYCRTLTTPESLAGTSCQEVVFDGNEATFIREDGTSSVFVWQS
jgi:hypothetical protein